MKPRSIDDVPILALTFWSKRYGDFELRRIAGNWMTRSSRLRTSAVALIGGERREIRITLDALRLGANNISPLQVVRGAG